MSAEQHIEQLLAGYFAGTLSQEEMDALEGWLHEHDRGVDLLVHHAMVEQGLITLSRHEVASDLMVALADAGSEEVHGGLFRNEPEDAEPRPRQTDSERYRAQVASDQKKANRHKADKNFRFPHGLAYAGLAACLLIATLLMSDVLRTAPTPTYKPGQQAEETRPDTPPQIYSARFLNSQNAVYETSPGDGPSGAGQAVRLTKGIAELAFDGGARVVVDAPTLFQPLGPETVQLETGRLTATVSQPTGVFNVHTPNLIFTEVGGVFGIDVAESGEVIAAVLHGEARVRQRNGGPIITLSQGQFIETGSDGVIGEVQVLPASISSILFSRTLEDAVTPQSRYSRSVLKDRPLLYWRFEELAARRVTNAEGTPSLDGAMFGGAQHVEGLLGKGVRFRGSMKHTGGIESIGELLDRDQTAYTLELWVKPDRHHHGCVVALARKPEPGQTMFQHHGFIEILGDNRWLRGQPAKENALRFLHRSPMSPNIDEGQNLWPADPYEPGQWMLLTAVKSEQHIALYLNGQLVANQADHQAVKGPAQLVIGSAGVSYKLNAWNVRPFDGVIDEVAVYGHALTAEQIAARYQLGVENMSQAD